ncbi:MAG: hypothetical protein M5R36_29455 [Deltaproteobacteria bacterium]|nr:hypothetical protein [Deltaproteobacteria bacterium]
MVAAIRAAEAMLGTGEKIVLPEEEELHDYARRGVQATRDITPGDELREGVNIDILRPGKRRAGVHPRRLLEIEGRMAARAVALGDGLVEGDWS